MRWYTPTPARVARLAAIAIVWAVVALTIFGIVAQARADGTTKRSPAPTIDCKTYGRHFTCASHGAEHLEIYPHWVLHTKQRFEAFGLDFSAAAPKRWTALTANFYADRDDEASADLQACVEVALVDGRAKFRQPCNAPKGDQKP